MSDINTCVEELLAAGARLKPDGHWWLDNHDLGAGTREAALSLRGMVTLATREQQSGTRFHRPIVDIELPNN